MFAIFNCAKLNTAQLHYLFFIGRQRLYNKIEYFLHICVIINSEPGFL